LRSGWRLFPASSTSHHAPAGPSCPIPALSGPFGTFHQAPAGPSCPIPALPGPFGTFHQAPAGPSCPIPALSGPFGTFHQAPAGPKASVYSLRNSFAVQSTPCFEHFVIAQTGRYPKRGKRGQEGAKGGKRGQKGGKRGQKGAKDWQPGPKGAARSGKSRYKGRQSGHFCLHKVSTFVPRLSGPGRIRLKCAPDDPMGNPELWISESCGHMDEF